MKVKSKALLKAENEYLKKMLLMFIDVIKKENICFESDIVRLDTKFTEIHKILIGNWCLYYDLENLYDLHNTTIAHEIHDEIYK
jgi:hypothetical protein